MYGQRGNIDTKTPTGPEVKPNPDVLPTREIQDRARAFLDHSVVPYLEAQVATLNNAAVVVTEPSDKPRTISAALRFNIDMNHKTADRLEVTAVPRTDHERVLGFSARVSNSSRVIELPEKGKFFYGNPDAKNEEFRREVNAAIALQNKKRAQERIERAEINATLQEKARVAALETKNNQPTQGVLPRFSR